MDWSTMRHAPGVVPGSCRNCSKPTSPTKLGLSNPPVVLEYGEFCDAPACQSARLNEAAARKGPDCQAEALAAHLAGARAAPDLPRFNPDAKCPKCGHDVVSTCYEPAGSCESLNGKMLWNPPERLGRTCQRCRYHWHEAVKEKP